MNIGKMMILGILSILVFAVSGFLVLLLGVWAGWARPGAPEVMKTIFALIVTGIPMIMTWLVARKVVKCWGATVYVHTGKRPRPLIMILLAAYMLTTILGIPAAQNKRDSWATEEYKRLGPPRKEDVHPDFRTYISIPVLPCVILSYHEYTIDWLYGLGSFEIALWYGTGVVSINFLPIWES